MQVSGYSLVIIIYFLIWFPVFAQHTLAVDPEDTIVLDLGFRRGDLQWQISYDNNTWNDLPGETKDSLTYKPDQFPAYFRVRMMEGTCLPHYSETVEVIVAGLPSVVTTAVQSTGTINAVVSGNVTGIGASAVTGKGVVYGTRPHPVLAGNLYTINGSGTGSFTALLTGLTSNTLYYVRAYATNSQGTIYGEEYSFRTQSAVLYVIGDTGPAGGIIFYDKGGYSDGWRYLEVAPAAWSGGPDPWTDVDWGCYEVFTGQTSTGIGTGKENTERILTNGCMTGNPAVAIAAGASIGGYTDWFLPSREELHVLYNVLYYLGGSNFRYIYGLHGLTYTSSSELDAMSAFGVAFGDGGSIQHLKIMATIAVRPVRRF